MLENDDLMLENDDVLLENDDLVLNNDGLCMKLQVAPLGIRGEDYAI